MPLRVAVQMDPLEGINIAGDSTFAIMLGAQARGTGCSTISPSLSYRDGRVWARAHPVTVQPRGRRSFHASASPRSSTSAATPTSC
jgi:glutathione synthase